MKKMWICVLFLLSTRGAEASEWSSNEGDLADKVMAADGAGEWITARRLAEELLRESPDSYTGHHVLGRAFWLGEGDYARASFHVRKALEIYDREYSWTEDPPWRLESEALWSLRIITGDMGDYEGELELIDTYNRKQEEYQQRFESSYNTLVAERGWPLMKLGRFAEVDYWAEQGMETERDWQVSLAWNSRCAARGEQGLREESVQACESALDHAHETWSGITIDASNASNAAFGIFDFTKAEKYSIEATKTRDASTVSAWINLVQLYLSEGRGESAVQATEGLFAGLMADDPAMRSQKRADVMSTFALVLLVNGEESKAFEQIDLALQYPDRRGVISTSEAQSRGSHALIRYIARKAKAQQEKEEIAALSWWQRMQHWWSSWFVDPELLIDASVVRNVLGTDDILLSTIRPYLDKGLTAVPTWLVGELVEIAGPGVMESALAEARELDSYVGTEGYYLALDTEIAFYRKDWERVIELSRQSIEQLSSVENLLQARLLAMSGYAHGKLGDNTQQIADYTQVMEIDPSVFRRLNIAIPTRFTLSGSDTALLDALRRSPRFAEEDYGFTLQISDAQVCLLSELGQSFSCAYVPSQGEEQSDDDFAKERMRVIHSDIFSISTGNSALDWNSLDGRATSSKYALKQRLYALLQTSTKKEKQRIDIMDSDDDDGYEEIEENGE